ncbi:MAG: response regulator, partial [Bdellovibrionales bacterium]|nr:response regulator [Bdellovibrionales bacterium]
VEKLMSVSLKAKDLTLVIEVDEKIPAVLNGDSERLRQVIINLVGNGIKFTPHGGGMVILVSLGSEIESDVCLNFSVADTGIGIKEEKQKDIFQAFSQADSSVTREYGGTGLGLAIVSQLVGLMSGKISLRSKFGIGSVFTFSIVVGRESNESQCSTLGPKSFSKVRSEPVKVLLVEDNPVNQKLALKILEQAGHAVVLASNGVEALRKVETDTFQVILMDVQMPMMGGEAATQAIRSLSDNPNQNVPIVALTAHAMQGDKEKYFSAGMNGYLSKPISRPALLQTITDLVPQDRGQARD